MTKPYYPIPSGQDRSLDVQTVSWYCKGCPYLAIDNSQRRNNITIISGNGYIVKQGVENSGPVNFSETTLGHHEYLNTKYCCTSPAFTTAQAQTQETSTIGGGYCPFLKSKLDLMYDSISDEGGGK